MWAVLLEVQIFWKETLRVSGFVVSQNLTGLCWHCDITKTMARSASPSTRLEPSVTYFTVNFSCNLHSEFIILNLLHHLLLLV